VKKSRFIIVCIGAIAFLVCSGFRAPLVFATNDNDFTVKAVESTTSNDYSEFTYRTGANPVSASYKNGKFYHALKNVTLTGDGATDTLAIALSQLGYLEGSSLSMLGGTQAGNANYTEYNYNFGAVTAPYYGYYWCASFVSWCLYQARQSSIVWTRNSGSKNNPLREVSCSWWKSNAVVAKTWRARSGYTPKSGDLILFDWSASTTSAPDHIGIVRYANSSTVFTVEGNTVDASGLESNGDGVYAKSYPLSYPCIQGYIAVDYTKNQNANRVDFSNVNRRSGWYVCNRAKTVSSADGSFIIPAFSAFEVLRIGTNNSVVFFEKKKGVVDNLSSTFQYALKDYIPALFARVFSINGSDVFYDSSQNPIVIENLVLADTKLILSGVCALDDGYTELLVSVNDSPWIRCKNSFFAPNGDLIDSIKNAGVYPPDFNNVRFENLCVDLADFSGRTINLSIGVKSAVNGRVITFLQMTDLDVPTVQNPPQSPPNDDVNTPTPPNENPNDENTDSLSPTNGGCSGTVFSSRSSPFLAFSLAIISSVLYSKKTTKKDLS